MNYVFKPGVVTVTASGDATLKVYVPNKSDGIGLALHAGDTVAVTTVNAGECFYYTQQASDVLAVEVAAENDEGGEGGEG